MLNNFFSFNLRVSRSVFWLRYLIVLPILNLSNYILLIDREIYLGIWLRIFLFLILILSSIFILAQSVQRMHDINKSGWYVLIPFYGLILCLLKGDSENNTYGPAPKPDNSIFSFSGNLSLSDFIFSSIYLGLMNVLIYYSLFGYNNISSIIQNGDLESRAIFIFYLVYYYNYLIGIVICVKRLNDIGKNGFYLLIPFYGIILLFFPSNYWESQQSNSNNYKNSTFSLYLLLILLALFFSILLYVFLTYLNLFESTFYLTIFHICFFEILALNFLNLNIVDIQKNNIEGQS